MQSQILHCGSGIAAAAAGRARQSVVSSPCAAPSRLPARSISRVSVSETLLVKRSVVPLKQGGFICRAQRVESSLTDIRPDQNPATGTYDYIIVGGGAAGCVLANRLSADPSKRVLVLEAGGLNNSRDVSIPAAITRLFKSPLDWNLYTDKEKALHERKVYLARGKLLGGSSATNATLYHRGAAADYDAWGIDGWRSKDVLEWFVSCENNDSIEKGMFHGKGGTMNVENPRYENRLHDVFFKAAEEAGLAPNLDFNDWSHPQEGFGEFQVTQQKGERADMFRQYLKPVLDRSNLQVVTGARTLKVDTEKSSSGVAAVGVQFSVKGPDGRTHAAALAAGGEVVLAAGATHTPQLLMLSGIGPAQQLKQHGIEVVADIAGVGANMQDHPACLVATRLRDGSGHQCFTDELYHRGSKNIKKRTILKYALFKRGPLASTGCDHGAFVNTLGGQQADLQVRFVPALSLDPDGVGSYTLFGQLVEQNVSWPSGVSLQLIAVRPKSRGTVGLHDADPFQSPALSPGFLSDAGGEDLATLRNGVRLARKLNSMPAFSEVLGSELHPGEQTQDDASIDEYIRTTLHSGNAVVGTCKMGPSVAAGAVVDSQLCVHGVANLRVVDASIIPTIPGGQTGAATIMVAERGAAAMLGSGADRCNAGQADSRVPVSA